MTIGVGIAVGASPDGWLDGVDRVAGLEWLFVPGVTGSDTDLASLLALATLTVGAAPCEPAVAGPLGLGAASGLESSTAICLAETETGLGTG